jgi:hypothetical protein
MLCGSLLCARGDVFPRDRRTAKPSAGCARGGDTRTRGLRAPVAARNRPVGLRAVVHLFICSLTWRACCCPCPDGRVGCRPRPSEVCVDVDVDVDWPSAWPLASAALQSQHALGRRSQHCVWSWCLAPMNPVTLGFSPCDPEPMRVPIPSSSCDRELFCEPRDLG